MVTMRSSFGMNDDRTFRVVVLPEPVPPDTKRLSRASMQPRRKSNISGVAVPNRIRSSTVYGVAANFRTVMTGPTRDSGAMIALTREPSGRRASTRGLESSMRRPIGVMIRSMIRSTCSSSRNVLSTCGDLARPLDVDLRRAVDHDLGDGRVAEERLERPEADHLVDQLVHEPHALVARHGEVLVAHDPVDDRLACARTSFVGQVDQRGRPRGSTSACSRTRRVRSISSRALLYGARASAYGTGTSAADGSGPPTGAPGSFWAAASCWAFSTRLSSDMCDSTSPRSNPVRPAPVRGAYPPCPAGRLHGGTNASIGRAASRNALPDWTSAAPEETAKRRPDPGRRLHVAVALTHRRRIGADVTVKRQCGSPSRFGTWPLPAARVRDAGVVEPAAVRAADDELLATAGRRVRDAGVVEPAAVRAADDELLAGVLVVRGPGLRCNGATFAKKGCGPPTAPRRRFPASSRRTPSPSALVLSFRSGVGL